MASLIEIEPLDTLFFGDGRPFNGADEGLANAASRFPPTPRTVVGAIRSALATGDGWTGEAWRKQKPVEKLGGHDCLPASISFSGPFLVEKLGGHDCLPASISFSGPFLVETRSGVGAVPDSNAAKRKKGKKSKGAQPEPEQTLWLPIPRNLLRLRGDGDWTAKRDDEKLNVRRLRPDPKIQVATDLSEGLNGYPPTCQGWGECAEISDYWVSAGQLKRLLHDKRNAETIERSQVLAGSTEILVNEVRTGVGLEHLDKAAMPGLLYTAQHSRLRSGFHLAMLAHGLDAIVPSNGIASTVERHPILDGLLHGFGGEGRAALFTLYPAGQRKAVSDAFQKFRPKNGVPAAISKNGPLWGYALYLLTPAFLDQPLQPGGRILDAGGEALPGTLLSACTGRSIGVGGWSGDGNQGGTVRCNRSAVPAGSVLFMTVGQENDPDAKKTVETEAIGSDTDWGFGQVVAGRW